MAFANSLHENDFFLTFAQFSRTWNSHFPWASKHHLSRLISLPTCSMYGYRHYLQDIILVGFSPVFNWSTKPSLSSYTSDTSRTCIESFLSLLSSSQPPNSILHVSRTSLISVQPINRPGCNSGGKLRDRMIWDMSPEKGNSGIHTPVQALQAPAGKVTLYSEGPHCLPSVGRDSES